jgi:ketosteroid isomerase-like protein
MLRVLILVLGLAACPIAVAQESQEIDDPLVAVRGFLDAFSALDMPTFIAYFAEDATLFHPPFSGPEVFPSRVEGRAEIQRSFQLVFDMFRRNLDKSRPPYIDIRPQDLLLQSYDDFAIVTFHLGTEANRQRRTLVLRKIESEWKIVHLHASSFDADAELPALDSSFVE